MDEAESICLQLDMAFLMHKRANKLSGGEKRKLCLAMAFVGKSELILLDEPTAGMDTRSRLFAKKFIEKEKNRRAIVLTTHYLDEAEAMGDWMYIMHMGRSVCSGSPYFLQQKFAPGNILTVVFKESVLAENVENAKKIIVQQLQNVKIRTESGRQIRAEIPKSERERLLKLFATFENEEKTLKIDSFGLSANAFEEAFLRIGEIRDKAENKNIEFLEDPRYAELQENNVVRILQQAKYIWLKKWWSTIYSIPLIVEQVFILSTIFALQKYFQHTIQYNLNSIESN
ncbi:unnamed protein product [Cylicocyclus nassatus]|uniref:ABC transporter domain-containing protein n=1 Tax=Cylicocyclus nassatus TaxID=53992 RepID=A0AA36GRK4_CYLNA|nr:unnamed protein product [Cylicocyclus nassatus]